LLNDKGQNIEKLVCQEKMVDEAKSKALDEWNCTNGKLGAITLN